MGRRPIETAWKMICASRVERMRILVHVGCGMMSTDSGRKSSEQCILDANGDAADNAASDCQTGETGEWLEG